MKSQVHNRRRRRISGSFRRSLLGALCLGLIALACICFALFLLAAPDANSGEALGVMQHPERWSGRRGLQEMKAESSSSVERASDVATDLKSKTASLIETRVRERGKRGPGRMRREAERHFGLKRVQSGPRSRGRLSPSSGSSRGNVGGFRRGLIGAEIKGHKLQRPLAVGRGDAIQLKTDMNLASGQVQNGTEQKMSLDPSGHSLSPELWSTFAKLARQRLILAEPRLHERRRISCGGSGTVGFRSWQELAHSIQEFDIRWPAEEPDLRALIARAQNTVPELERRPSCAVVGNSGRLLQHEHGAEIDKLDLVIRFNWGKTDGYEKHVGTKSHVRIYNGPYVSQKQPGEITLAEIRDPALREWVRKRDREEAEHAFAFDPEFLCHVWDWVGRSGEKPSTGLVGVILALKICASVDVFGFHYEDYFDPNIQPHYYDWERPKVGREKAHPFEREYQLYQQLESQACFRCMETE